MSTFVKEVKVGRSERWCNDDLMMCLVMFGWLSNQKHFKVIDKQT